MIKVQYNRVSFTTIYARMTEKIFPNKSSQLITSSLTISLSFLYIVFTVSSIRSLIIQFFPILFRVLRPVLFQVRHYGSRLHYVLHAARRGGLYPRRFRCVDVPALSGL
jgi:hypothetical protein